MSRYKAYPEYKDSGVEWLGAVPVNWIPLGLGKVIKFMNNGSSATQIEQSDETVGITRIETISEGIIDEKKIGYVRKCDLSEHYLLKKGDILFSNINSLSMIGNCAIFDGEKELYAGINLLHIRPNKHRIFSRYMLYQFKTKWFRNRVEAKAKPAINQASIPTRTLKLLEFLCPSEEEQIQIANFLDHETAKIDALIEKQQQLIKLLKEKRQAVISHAVTKGLNPNVPMRDSGVEWFGRVPKHWVDIPLKLIVTTKKGTAFKSGDFCDHGIRVVKASDIKQLSVRASDLFLPEKFMEIFPKGVLASGDIILSTVGSNPEVVNSAVGQIGMIPQELVGAFLNQNTVVYQPDERKIAKEYLFYVLQTRGYRDHLDLQAHGTANQSSLNISEMLDFIVPLPPIHEQIEVCNFLNALKDKLKQLEKQSNTLSLFLQERRAALISAAVTGKIDVKNWKPPKPSCTNKKRDTEHAV